MDHFELQAKSIIEDKNFLPFSYFYVMILIILTFVFDNFLSQLNYTKTEGLVLVICQILLNSQAT